MTTAVARSGDIEMPRDTYNDFISTKEVDDCRSHREITLLLAERFKALAKRSGACNVANATIDRYSDFDLVRSAVQLSVRFDSRAWTGLR
jgi:hypothetical protein